MKKPILIVNIPSSQYDEDTRIKLENTIKDNETFKDFEVIIFWGCEATIYYPPKE